MAVTMIATFGEAPGGIIEGIKQFGCQKLILLISDKPQKDSQRNLRKIEDLAGRMRITVKKVTVPPYDVMGNIQKIKQLIEDNGDDVILNVTGGRKPLSLAASLAGFVSNPKDIIYIQEENNQPISIPRFTIYEKLLSNEKREVLNYVTKDTALKDINVKLGKNHKKYHTIKKHLTELEKMGLIKSDRSWPRRYSITPSGELLR
jgi:CRISPR locus-related DNA-binding protein